MRRSLFALSFALWACGSGDVSNENEEPPPDAVWTPLVTHSWSLEPLSENTSDVEIVVLDRDYYIGGIRPIAPLGTHHTLLARGNDLSTSNIIYASGVGTNAMTFPAGTGLKLESRSLLLLQLHVFNTSDAPLSGTSGIEVLEIDPANVVEQVDLLLAGPLDLSIPPGQVSTQAGTCTATERQTLFALFPHMHQLGTHFKTTLTVGGVPRVIHDAPYSFEHQEFYSIDPVVLEPGDSITSECTWTNDTTQTIGWGESSTTEMCFSILYRSPTIGDGFCDDD